MGGALSDRRISFASFARATRSVGGLESIGRVALDRLPVLDRDARREGFFGREDRAVGFSIGTRACIFLRRHAVIAARCRGARSSAVTSYLVVVIADCRAIYEPLVGPCGWTLRGDCGDPPILARATPFLLSLASVARPLIRDWVGVEGGRWRSLSGPAAFLLEGRPSFLGSGFRSGLVIRE